VLALVERRQLPADLLASVRDAIGRAKKIAKIRNLVAHGPLALGWQKGKKEQGPPDVIAIANLHSLRHHGAGKDEIVRREGLERAFGDAGRLVKELHALRKQVMAAPTAAWNEDAPTNMARGGYISRRAKRVAEPTVKPGRKRKRRGGPRQDTMSP
jgi:hypothetical protein